MLLELIRREARLSHQRVLFLAGLAGLANALILAIINAAAQGASNDEYSFRYLLLLVLVVAVYVLTQRQLMVASTAEMEDIVHRLRMRLAAKIRDADLERLERIGRSGIYASISKNTLAISQATETLVVALQAALLIVFTSLYIWWLSRTAFIVCALFTAAALSIHFRKVRESASDLYEAMARENRMFEAVTDLLDGFKEARLNAARSASLYDHVQAISVSARDLKVRTHSRIAEHFVFSQSVFFLLMAAMVFVVPRLSGDQPDGVVIKGTAAVLFLIGPITTLVAAVPIFGQANAAAQGIYVLEAELDAAGSEEAPAGVPATSYETIRFEGVTFSYRGTGGDGAFTVGPVDLTIERGKIVFIAGGNGTGKSTFLKLLTGLYTPQQGRIMRNGIPVTAQTYASYRQLFAAVLTDYHLFARLHGLERVAPERVEALLGEFELAGKTRLVDGGFETLDLSGGQRKRLALLVALLEERPILVLDEFAADQDPAFRRRFYTEILPRLKAEGKTIVAVTHDDRYLDAADRLLRMEDGRFVDQREAPAHVH